MATNNRTGSRRRNNNPSGRNQYSGVTGTPLMTAAAVGGAVAAGLFLWSRRNEISDRLTDLTDQISDWREGGESEGVGRSQAEISQEALTLKELGRTA